MTAAGLRAEGTLRLDRWLVYARFCKTRSQACRLIGGGRLRVNRQVVSKPHHQLRIGDVLTFPLGAYVRVVEVAAVAERRGPAVEARTMYRDLSPPEDQPRPPRPAPAPGTRPVGAGRPTKRERRVLDRLRAPRPEPEPSD